MALTKPENWHFTLLGYEPAAARKLEFPATGGKRWIAGILVGFFFAIFAAVLVGQILALRESDAKGVFGAAMMLFQVFWIVGWSVGVVILGLLTALLLFYRESAFVSSRRLLMHARIGPFGIVSEYDLAKMRNVRLDKGANRDTVKIRFDYNGGTRSIGDDMNPAEGERIVARLTVAQPRAGEMAESAEETASTEPSVPSTRVAAPAAPVSPSPATRPDLFIPRRRLWTPSSLALIAANLLPLAGVLFGHWTLGHVMLLYWSESAVIGIYTVVKMILVGRAAALVAAPFFLAHYGGFMAIHFVFVWTLFLDGLGKGAASEPALAAVLENYRPLWGALLALFASHGVSFVVNFLRQPGYGGETISSLMGSPYGRIMILHVTLIFGGFAAQAMKSITPALVMLIAIKIGTDLWSHTRHYTRTAQGNS